MGMAAMQTSMQTVDMEISRLGSGLASRGVRSALECIRGVAQVRMVPNERYVTVTYDAFRVRPRQFETAVRVMGCEVARLAPAVNRAPDAEAAAGPNPSGDQKE